MNAYSSIAAAAQDRTVAEIDALIRNLENWRHWAATKADRAEMRDGTDKQRRLYLTADRISQEARRDTLRVAYTLFQIDGLHEAYLDACFDTGFDADVELAPTIQVGMRGVAI